jgi:hypothetical protein
MPYAWRYNERPVMKISAVMVLIAANVAVYLIEKWLGEPFMTLFALWPLQPYTDGQSYFHSWQIVTYAFLHDPRNLAHIGFNMLALYMFGTEIERYAGPWRLLACYFASVVTAALAQLLVQSLPGAPFDSTVGASGGVFGLLLAFAMMFASQSDSADPADPHAGMAVRRAVRGGGAAVRRHRHAVGHRAFRAPRRHGRQRAGGAELAAARAHGALSVPRGAVPIGARNR